MYGKPGLCIVTDVDRPEPAVLEAIGEFAVAVIGDGLGRQRIMDCGIKPLDPATTICGPAITVEVDPADNLMIHAALKLARPGDVLVVNAHGNVNHGVWGEIMTSVAVRKKLGGLVIDGAVRDSRDIVASGFPVFSRGVCPLGGGKEGDGQVNLPIACGGVPVNPGDIVLGDADGVIVIPKEMAATAIAAARKKHQTEAKRLETIRTGAESEIYPAWLIPTLRAKGVLGEADDL